MGVLHMKYHKERSGSPARIKTSVSQRSITWERYVTLLDQYCPKEEKEEPEPVERREEQRDMVSEIETEDTDCKEPAGKPDREGREVSVSMDELVEEGRKKQLD